MLRTITQLPGSSPDRITLIGKDFSGRQMVRKDIRAGQVQAAERGMLYHALYNEFTDLLAMSYGKAIDKHKAETALLKLQDAPAFTICKAVVESLCTRWMDISPVPGNSRSYALFCTRIQRIYFECCQGISYLGKYEPRLYPDQPELYNELA